MKKNNFIILLALGLIGLSFEMSAEASGFHQKGTVDCTGCHMARKPGKGDRSKPLNSDLFGEKKESSMLLNGPDASSTCLNCHAKTMRVLTGNGSAFTPGGDFFWLTKSYNKAGSFSPGDSHGHNIMALEFNLREDSTLPMAPGDGVVEYQSSWMGCTSCHDPHASIADDSGAPAVGSSFRMLAGVGYTGGSQASGISFTNPAPVAKSYAGEGTDYPSETDSNHTDYGYGMSEWCTNCHSGLASELAHKHPSGQDAKFRNLATLYNFYVATGDMSGTHDSAYDHFVPFERGLDNLNELSPESTTGPDSGSNVMCLSCHRAHASPFAHSGRWDFQATFLAESAIFSNPEGANAYYGESIQSRYGEFQRSLCNKCHAQD
jgi:hypothetical protein